MRRRQSASGVSYELLARWDVERLNQILATDTPAFTGVTVTYTPARTRVRLYRVTYPSVIPERGNRPTVATGLLAVPEAVGTSFPMVSYQHGTVYGKQQVPSFPDQSPETQLMIAQFAGQGYRRHRRRLFRHGRLGGARRLHGQGQPSAGLLTTC